MPDPRGCITQEGKAEEPPGRMQGMQPMSKITLRRGVDPNYVPGRNAELIRAQASRVICGTVPRQVRAELREAVKAGYLGHLAKDGLKPEIFFHPDHKNGAIERQNREAEYAIGCIAKVLAPTTAAERVESALADLKD